MIMTPGIAFQWHAINDCAGVKRGKVSRSMPENGWNIDPST
jgi:hypothetical protein